MEKGRLVTAVKRYLEGAYMADFVLNVVAEVADFFIDFWTDKVIDKFAKKKQIKND